jgi:competence protein ComEC
MGSFSFHNIPALRFSLLLVIGILVGKALDLPLYLLVMVTACFLLIAIVVFFWSRRSASQDGMLTMSVVMLCVLVGATKISADSQSSIGVQDGMFTKEIVVIGQIDEPPSVVNNRKKFVLNTSEIIDGSVTHAFDANVLAKVKRKTRDTIDVKLEYGMCIALKGKITRPSDVRNPGEFSARQYYEANGISWMMYVRGFDNVVVLDSSGGWWFMRDIVVPARNYVIGFIDRTIGGDEGEFLKGILIGERSGISPSTKESFRNSGVAHVLAVSGAHVAVVAVFLFFLVQVLRLPKAIRIALISIGLLFYMLLTGSNPPVVRATIMALVILFGGLFQEKRNIYNSLGVAALIILAIDARQLFDVGFQLSFVAVFSIVYLYPRINSCFDLLPERTWWHRAFIWTLRICAVSTAAIVGTLPLTAIYFGRVSLIGVASNIIVMPAVGLSVTIGLISLITSVASQWVGEVYSAVNQLLLHGTLFVTDLAGNLSFAYVDTLRFTLVDMLPFYAGAAFLFHLNVTPVARKLFILFLAALNISVFYPPSASFASAIGKLRLSVIAVGQGDAIFVEFPDGKTMLVDAGPRIPQYDAGEKVVAPVIF